ncbi:quinone-dependent dihydroorotate dehydrogenase [Allochromatium vinosum]|uniref:Dihydroorotate dehydrogenase (quinone) n=1 Tax=Allochromatium vinosum (strain ATCC 17899 / DSM 180 / NBRC 103801 / NCIMB 10441 / D) TaxID=572477 RepID=D3RQ20_ALLVD|nr:quinone-dependent dihydroorotate dehydrogenase [Allochromatium vinosum]ADC63631.1 dihydroorotate dehydrogenase [Allochromatium vinosum DSM 180]MBK1655211.1 quinone-dependent dihydroorotate dehydrogenase [Allochromatium vinosum]
MLVTPPWPLARAALFKLDPEQAHNLTLGLLARWSALFDGRLGPSDIARRPTLARDVMGLRFPNPIGLAAGLDKQGEAVPAWQALGFGFVEVGTVTALPQPGNPRPRLFRLAADEALVNRMGFNNGGAEAMARRLQRLRARGLPEIPLGVNLGKSKVTPPEQAAADYRQSFERLGELADYVVVNISSPNTPGLRDLQRVDEVARILEAIQEPNQRLSRPRPLLVKLAPDLADDEAIECARAALEAGATGLILTNTTIRFEGLRSSTEGLSGGLSGRPLLARSTELLGKVRAALGPEPVIIGVGGILDPEGARAKLAAGADLIQVYTGLIYRGPGFVRELLRGL